MRALWVMAAIVAAGPVWGQTPALIDTHVHVDGRLERRGDADWEGAARRAIERMDEAGVRLSLALPPPQPVNFPYPFDCDDYAAALRRHAGRFGLVCGGGTINPAIYEAAGQARLDAATTRRLDELVKRHAAAGAVAIGELTAQHFSFNARHPYLGMSPDHPAFLHLADLAARHRLPLVLHMEAVAGSFDMPQGLRRMSEQNPSRIADNMAALERLLTHNRQATIVWSHFGWDNTGQRVGERMRELFARHPNLFADLKLQPGVPPSRGALNDDGTPRAEFVAAIEADSGRYMIGSDAFYSIRPVTNAREVDRLATVARTLIQRLSPVASRRVGWENAGTVYRLRDHGLAP